MTDVATTVTVIDACGLVCRCCYCPIRGWASSTWCAVSRPLTVCPARQCLSIREPADIAGLPVIGAGGVVLDPPAWARRLAEAGSGYLFLDELTTCPPSVLLCTCQAAAGNSRPGACG